MMNLIIQTLPGWELDAVDWSQASTDGNIIAVDPVWDVIDGRKDELYPENE